MLRGLDFDSLEIRSGKDGTCFGRTLPERMETPTQSKPGERSLKECERSYRVEGVITDGEKVLFIKHSGNDGRPDEWLLPGGGKVAGESDEMAVKREVLEETCLAIEPAGMIAEVELPDDGLYYSAKMFHFIYDGSEPSPGSEPEDVNGNYYTISEVKWIDLSDLSSIADEYRTFPHMSERLEAIRDHLLKMNH